MRAVLLTISLLGQASCFRSGFESYSSSQCDGQDCSGHGVCVTTAGGGAHCACDPGYVNDGDTSCVSAATVGLVVEKTYPDNGANWNDYVRRDGAVEPRPTVDVACDYAAEPRPRACIHGAERLQVSVPGEDVCAELALAEALSAFDWACVDEASGPVFYSLGLKPDKRLADLLTEDGFLPNQVTITRSDGSALRSSARAWWDNPVQPLPDNSAAPVEVLDQAGTIYVLGASRASNGYNINADHVALVILRGAVLSYAGVAEPNCNGTWPDLDGEVTPSESRCLVAAGSQTALWIEGSFDGRAPGGAHAELGILLAYPNVSVLRHASVRGNTSHGVFVEWNYNGRYAHVASSDNGGAGFYFHYGDHFEIRDLVASNNVDAGLRAFDIAGEMSARGIRSLGNGGRGVSFADGVNGSYSNIFAANNGSDGVLIDSIWYDPMSVLNVTAVNNLGNGIILDELTFGTATRLTAINNGGDGIQLVEGSGDNRHAQLLSTGNLGVGLSCINTFGHDAFELNALLGDNGLGNCAVSGTGSHDLDGLCNSTAHVVQGVDVGGSFLGAVASDDASNDSDREGAASVAEIDDWVGFDNPYRVWGPEAASLTAPEARGPCTGACRIWDWRVRADDAALRGRAELGDQENVPFAANAACPPAIHGDRVVSNPRSSPAEVFGDGLGNDDGQCDTDEPCAPIAYLADAFELLDDYLGNDNGLCESNEACVYAPNFGPFQGEGELEGQTCLFQPGVVRRVTMYAYPTTGI